MTSVRILAMSIAWVVISSSVMSAQDLSRYREFQLGMSVVTVARQAGITAEAPVRHRLPALIQELMWQPPRIFSPRPQRESVGKVLFSFYNDQLFRMVITYDRDRTLGLTAEDLVEAISTRYGIALLPPAITTSLAPVSNGGEQLLATWEDAQHSLILFRASHPSTFGLVVLSKDLDALAHAATVETMLLDNQEAPQRAIAQQPHQTEGDRVKHGEARRVNKPTFRP